MELRRELMVAIGVLLAMHLITTFGAIGLLVRMTPAIENILRENIVSNEAADEMLSILAEAGHAAVELHAQKSFNAALERARRNITEDAERSVLDSIGNLAPLALAGSSVAVREVVSALNQLISINRNAMGDVDREAQRLGTAGAWALVFLSLVTFLVGIAVLRRIRLHVMVPLVELRDTLLAAQSGDRFRRAKIVDPPLEVRHLLESVNQLLDERASKQSR